MPDRIIRESICISDTLNELSDFEERFWHRLIVNCDDYGRFDARPAILKGRLFPLMDGKTQKDISKALSKLASVGLVELYEVGGKPFLHVVTWDKYQRIRAKRSKFPAPDEENAHILEHDSTCRHVTADDGKCSRNPIQSESNPNPNPSERVTRASARFTPPTVDEVRAYCQERKNGVDPERFVDFYASKGWMVGKNKMADWKSCVRTWERRQEPSAQPPAKKSFSEIAAEMAQRMGEQS